VRKTAVMGCIKVHFLNPEALRSKRKVFFYWDPLNFSFM
jgi:hypothetical protein